MCASSASRSIPTGSCAARSAATGEVEFGLGGFELAGLRPVLVRAFNVLRQYPVDAVAEAWSAMGARLAPGGLIVDGTCDELGRRCAGCCSTRDGPVSLTLACDPFAIERPSDLAERLPKVLIHHNVAGQPIHALLTAADRAWASVAGHGVFGPRVRWRAMLGLLRDEGFQWSRRAGGCATACLPCRGRPWRPTRLTTCGLPWRRSSAGTEPAANLGLVEEYTRRAVDAGAQLVLFPEATMCRFGVPLGPIAEPLDGSWASGVRSIADRAGIVVVAGMFVPATRRARVTNTLVAAGPQVSTPTTTRSTSTTRSASPNHAPSHRDTSPS